MIVVADTSVILNLCKVGHEHLLPTLFKEVWIPEAVRREFSRLSQAQPRFDGIALPAWAMVSPMAVIPSEVASQPGLHACEAAALALAITKHADSILMDEAAGRRAARTLGITVIGVLGVLLQAKRAGLISEIKPVLNRLEVEAGFWLSASVVQQALLQAGEQPD